MKIINKIKLSCLNASEYIISIILLNMLWIYRKNINKYIYYGLDHSGYYVSSYILTLKNKYVYFYFYKPFYNSNTEYFTIQFEYDIFHTYSSKSYNLKTNKKFIIFFSNYIIEVRKRKLKNIK